MIFAVFLYGFIVAFQLICMLRGKKIITKILPLLIGLLLIGVSVALMAWNFSLPLPANDAEFYRHEDQFTIFFGCFGIGLLEVAVGVLGWLIYGVIFLFRIKRNDDCTE